LETVTRAVPALPHVSSAAFNGPVRRETTALPRAVAVPRSANVCVLVAGRAPSSTRAVAEAPFAITTFFVSTPFRVPFRKRSNQATPWETTYALSTPGKVDGGWPKLPA